VALLDIPVHVLRASKDFIIWNALRLAPAIGWLGVVAYAALTSKAEAAFIAGCYLFSLAVLCVPILHVVKSRTSRPWRPDILGSGPMVRYGLQCHANGLAQLCNVRLDQLLIAAALPVQSLGLYAVAVAWSSGLQPLSSAFSAVLFPEVASRTSRGAQSGAVADGSRLGTIATIVVGIAVLAVTPWAVQFLFGESFSGAIPAALVLVITSVVGGVGQVFEGGIRGMGAPGIIFQAELARLGVMIVCLLLFLLPWGILGAAFASLVGTSVSTGLLIYRAGRLTRVGMFGLFTSARANTQPL
jgi:O-antigen/teichoic acid export membrane protein